MGGIHASVVSEVDIGAWVSLEASEQAPMKAKSELAQREEWKGNTWQNCINPGILAVFQTECFSAYNFIKYPFP